ncbi:MAG: FecR domain-containing protein [Spirochaetes bacterium]|nr:FecR domain-containing protein [Spirochaetota bacterium]
MKRPLLLLLIASLFVFLNCTKTADNTPAKTAAPAAAPTASGIVNEVVGKATILTGTVEHAAAIGDTVVKGDVIRTSAGAKMTFKVEGVGVFNIKESSEIRVDALLGAGEKEVRMKVARGKILVGIRKLTMEESAVIETPTSVAAVRGTSFVVDSAGKDTKVSVLTGSVNVQSDKGSVDVNELKEVSVAADGKLALVEISKESLSDVKEIITIKDIESIKNVGNLKDNLKKLSLRLEQREESTGGKTDVKIDAADIKAREALKKGEMDASSAFDVSNKKKLEDSKELMIDDKKEY